MKLLILTASIGGGHNACASAVEKAAAELGWSVEVVDLYAYLGEESILGLGLKQTKEKGYQFSLETLARLPSLVEEFYDLNEKREIGAFSFSRMQAVYCALRISDLLRQSAPDAVLCTQVYTAQAVDVLVEKGDLSCMTAGVITDFTVQTYWQDVPHLNHIAVASEELSWQLAQRGIGPERTLSCGIPIDPKFGKKKREEEAKRELALPADRPVVLMMGGSMGFGDVEERAEALARLPKALYLVVICGNNEKLEKRLVEKELPNTRVLGYTHQVDLYMDAACMLLTKPGGITTSEALAKGLPLVVCDPIPGLESRNTEFLQNRGLAVFVTKTYPVEEAVYNLLEYPATRVAMAENCRRYGRPQAAYQLCRCLENAFQKREVRVQ